LVGPIADARWLAKGIGVRKLRVMVTVDLKHGTATGVPSRGMVIVAPRDRVTEIVRDRRGLAMVIARDQKGCGKAIGRVPKDDRAIGQKDVPKQADLADRVATVDARAISSPASTAMATAASRKMRRPNA
jgi:hypothetical protein